MRGSSSQVSIGRTPSIRREDRDDDQVQRQVEHRQQYHGQRDHQSWELDLAHQPLIVDTLRTAPLVDSAKNVNSTIEANSCEP